MTLPPMCLQTVFLGLLTAGARTLFKNFKFFSIGLGKLVGAPTQLVSEIVNQLIDAGTLKNNPAGFVGWITLRFSVCGYHKVFYKAHG